MVIIFSEYGEYILSVIALGILFGVVIHYLISGWIDRRREILGSFSKKAIEEYIELFFFSELRGSENPELAFRRLYHKRFVRRYFLIPGACLLAISGFLLVLVSSTVFVWLRKESNYPLDLPPIAVAAVAGAYMWVLYDFIGRARRRDLGPTDLFGASLRFLIAAPLGFAIATLFRDEVGVPIALLLGAFPTRALFTIARRVVTSKLNLGSIGEERGYELESLQGIGRAQAERFEDEGVANILQLAYSDPLDLTIRTNFSFSYVVDCCSQALAWLYFQRDLEKMRRFGLRGGQEIQTLISEIDGDYEGDAKKRDDVAKRAKKCRDLVAAELKMDPQALERSMREIAEDPYTRFLYDVWCTP